MKKTFYLLLVLCYLLLTTYSYSAGSDLAPAKVKSDYAKAVESIINAAKKYEKKGKLDKAKKRYEKAQKLTNQI